MHTHGWCSSNLNSPHAKLNWQSLSLILPDPLRMSLRVISQWRILLARASKAKAKGATWRPKSVPGFTPTTRMPLPPLPAAPYTATLTPITLLGDLYIHIRAPTDLRHIAMTLPWASTDSQHEDYADLRAQQPELIERFPLSVPRDATHPLNECCGVEMRRRSGRRRSVRREGRVVYRWEHRMSPVDQRNPRYRLHEQLQRRMLPGRGLNRPPSKGSSAGSANPSSGSLPLPPKKHAWMLSLGPRALNTTARRSMAGRAQPG
ncbi:hypothetical protein BKA70DRAFT_86754 [Coprinopsis sp. MPI-PUGE-AT-0042]|nr:hypothetical protein BKA70DRAFT_86754 [Coprinopsis sp. MPI-PUGE-AT-0042]